MFSISKVDHFPEITRQGRVSEELQAIISALQDSANKGERFCINGIDSVNAYNSMQQRIRAQAKKLDLKVTIRYEKDEANLYFKASHNGLDLVETEEVGMTASEAGAKTSSKRSAKIS